MNIKLFNVALGIALTATTLSASAQKAFTSGLITLKTSAMGQQLDAKDYFTPDSTAVLWNAGPVSIRMLANSKFTYFAVLVDVSVASKKIAGVATPDEIDQLQSSWPKFTFAPTSETKQISGFNCKKVVATDSKANKTYDVWITNDISLPDNAIANYYSGIGGVPIQYTSFNQGQSADVTIISITDQKAPAGTFSVTADYDKITLDELKAMSGGGKQ